MLNFARPAGLRLCKPGVAPVKVAARVVALQTLRKVNEPAPVSYLIAPRVPVVLKQLVGSITAESDWGRRDTMFNRIELAGDLDRGDETSMRAIASWSEDLSASLGTSTARFLVPLFTELYAVKELRSIYLERRMSLMWQRQAAMHASAHLMDSMEALEEHSRGALAQHPRGTREFHEAEAQKRSYPTGSETIGGIYGLAQRLELRYTAQVKALDMEMFRATAFLHEMGSDVTEAAHLVPKRRRSSLPAQQRGHESGRDVEVVTSVREADLKQKLAAVLEQLREDSLQQMMKERAEATIFSRLADIAAEYA